MFPIWSVRRFLVAVALGFVTASGTYFAICILSSLFGFTGFRCVLVSGLVSKA